MAALTFELTTLPGTISGDVNYYELAGGGDYNPVLTPLNPAQIHDDQPWEIRLQGLTQTGAIFGAFGGNVWQFKVLFELLGGGEAAPGFKQITFAVNTTVPFTYADKVISFAPGEIPVGEYKIYATLKMVDANHLSPIAGAGELTQSGTLLQIINA